jgi:DNA polymerase V
MHQAICAYAERAAEKLRGEHQYCRFISVFVRTSPHADNEIYYGNQASVTLMTPTNDSRDIIRAATEALGRIWLDGYRYMKAGVMLADFFSSGVAQLNLFDDNRLRANSAALMEMIDSVNHSGKGKIWFAGQGIEKPWAMKRECCHRPIRRGTRIYRWRGKGGYFVALWVAISGSNCSITLTTFLTRCGIKRASG